MKHSLSPLRLTALTDNMMLPLSLPLPLSSTSIPVLTSSTSATSATSSIPCPPRIRRKQSQSLSQSQSHTHSHSRSLKHSIILLLLASRFNGSNANIGNIGNIGSHILGGGINSILVSSTLAGVSSTSNSNNNNKKKKKSSSTTVVSGGLINLGNTCYLNSQLECAYHVPKVRNIILDPNQHHDDDDDDDGSNDNNESSNSANNSNSNNNISTNIPLQSLQKVFQLMHVASQRGRGDINKTPSTSTSTLCHNLGINVYEQQDSQEFWKLLLPELHYPPLTHLYKGYFTNYIRALDMDQDGDQNGDQNGSNHNQEKLRKEIFVDLSLNVCNFDNVHDSLMDMFTESELLSVEDGNGWRPYKGADRIDALKGCTIVQDGLPKLLQLHLMRFKYDMMTGGMSKINDRFVFPKELDLTPICQEVNDETKQSGKDKTKKGKEKAIFDLQSIVIHAGEYGSGHYYAYVRPDVRKNKWYRYDDDRVSEVTFQMVKDDAFGGHVVSSSKTKNKKRNKQSNEKKGFWGRLFSSSSKQRYNYGWGGRSSSAYMLQYVKRSEIPSLYG